MFNITAKLFSLASFLGVVAVSVDRFLAVHLHLRYHELVTHKRVIAVLISIWVFSAFFSLISFWSSRTIQDLILLIGGVIGLLLTTVVYMRIYLVARRHKNQIQSLQVQVEQTGERAQFASLIKSAVGIFYVYLVFLICYLPYWICVIAIRISGPSIALKRFYHLSGTLVFLNSSLNPVIYCWKMRHIRQAIMKILQKISWNRRTEINHGTNVTVGLWVLLSLLSFITESFCVTNTRGGGGYSQKNWVGVCGPLPKTLTLFMTKICHFPYPIYDLTKNLIPYLWPVPYINTLLQTCLIIISLVQTSVKGNVYLLLLGRLQDCMCKEVASSKWNEFKTRVQKSVPYLWPQWRQNGYNRYPIYDQNGWKTIPFGAAHTYIAHIREYPPTPPGTNKVRVQSVLGGVNEVRGER